jgi:hypothetical protein
VPFQLPAHEVAARGCPAAYVWEGGRPYRPHISRTLGRLGLRDRTQAAIDAHDHGLLQPSRVTTPPGLQGRFPGAGSAKGIGIEPRLVAVVRWTPSRLR